MRYLLIIVLFLTGCATVKRDSETITERTTETALEVTKDSISEIEITKGFNTEVEYDLSFLAGNDGDFSNTLYSDDDSEFSITKEGNKLKIKAKQPDSRKETTNVSSSEEKTSNTNEYTLKTIKTVIRRVPILWKVIIGLVVTFFMRKTIFSAIGSVFPAFRATKIFSLVFRSKEK